MNDINYSKLDYGVRNLVQYFNDKGLKTCMSCEGHDNKYQSMFWIEFSKAVTEQDILNFQTKHLNEYGCFVACGCFAQRLLYGPISPEKRWRYMAAGQNAADIDLLTWSKQDEMD